MEKINTKTLARMIKSLPTMAEVGQVIELPLPGRLDEINIYEKMEDGQAMCAKEIKTVKFIAELHGYGSDRWIEWEMIVD